MTVGRLQLFKCHKVLHKHVFHVIPQVNDPTFFQNDFLNLDPPLEGVRLDQCQSALQMDGSSQPPTKMNANAL